MERFVRTEALCGDLEPLINAKVAVIGVGGVGGYCAEALARCGIGSITLVDGDKVALSNINRQIIALTSTLGRNKARVMAERIADINPDCRVKVAEEFLTPDNMESFCLTDYDYVADCIDSVTAKIALIEYTKKIGVEIISCMGAGNKITPNFEVADIKKTSVCPLARVMRGELKKRGIEGVKVVFSREEPVVKSRTPSSVSFVPSVAGLIMASEIVKDLLKKKAED